MSNAPRAELIVAAKMYGIESCIVHAGSAHRVPSIEWGNEIEIAHNLLSCVCSIVSSFELQQPTIAWRVRNTAGNGWVGEVGYYTAKGDKFEVDGTNVEHMIVAGDFVCVVTCIAIKMKELRKTVR